MPVTGAEDQPPLSKLLPGNVADGADEEVGCQQLSPGSDCAAGIPVMRAGNQQQSLQYEDTMEKRGTTLFQLRQQEGLFQQQHQRAAEGHLCDTSPGLADASTAGIPVMGAGNQPPLWELLPAAADGADDDVGCQQLDDGAAGIPVIRAGNQQDEDKQLELGSKVKKSKNKKARWRKNLEMIAAGCCVCQGELQVGVRTSCMVNSSTGEKRFRCESCTLAAWSVH